MLGCRSTAMASMTCPVEVLQTFRASLGTSVLCASPSMTHTQVTSRTSLTRTPRLRQARSTCGPDARTPNAQAIVQRISTGQLHAGWPDLLHRALQARMIMHAAEQGTLGAGLPECGTPALSRSARLQSCAKAAEQGC